MMQTRTTWLARLLLLAMAILGWLGGAAVHASPDVDDCDDLDTALVSDPSWLSHAPDDAPIDVPPRPAEQPQVSAVLEAAYRAAGLDRDPTASLRRRARLAGLVPIVALRAGRNTRWEQLEPDIDYGTTYEARATWRLDRLVFDARELQATTMQIARRRERARLASRVIRLYFAWRRAVASGRIERAEEAAAELDALTDDWFSSALPH